MPDKTPSPDRTHAPARSRPLRWLAWIAAGLAGLALLLSGIALVAVKTEWGTRMLWEIATRALPAKLSGQLAGGTLGDGVRLRNLVYRDDKRVLNIDQLEGAWRLSLSPFTLTVNFLRIDKADVALLPSPPTPTTLPQQITLPLAIDLRSATVRELVIHKDTAATAYRDIRIKADSDGVRHALQLQNAVTPYGTAHAIVRLDGAPPFAISGSADLAGVHQDQRYNVDARVSGTLQALDVRLNAAGDKLAGSAHIEATPFAAVPFRRAQIDLDHVNPRLFSAGAPQADLKIRATLAPLGGDAQTDDLSQLAVAGPVSIANARPGPIDKGLLPLVSAGADVTLDMQRQQISRLDVRLSGDATLKGTADMRGGVGRLMLQADKLDLHALYTKLTASVIFLQSDIRSSANRTGVYIKRR